MTRDEAYQVLADLIQKGFLAQAVTIGDHRLIFKTINEREYQLIRMFAGGDGNLFNQYFLAYSLLMLDGRYVLHNREDRIYEYKDMFTQFPKVIYARILEELSKIRTQAFDAMKYLEGYTYTRSSRYSWKTMYGKTPISEEYTGIPGSSKIGLNVHQESWIYINRSMDEEEQYNHRFSMAILVASASNPKGSKQIRSKHEAAVNDAEEKRRKLAIAGYIDTKKKWTSEGWAAPVDTAEELLAELDRQMRGEKDRHDIFMENYLRSLRENAEARVQAAKQRIEEARKKNEDMPDLDGSVRVLSPKEAEQMLSRNRGTLVKVHGEGEVTGEDRERFLKKIGNKILTGK